MRWLTLQNTNYMRAQRNMFNYIVFPSDNANLQGTGHCLVAILRVRWCAHLRVHDCCVVSPTVPRGAPGNVLDWPDYEYFIRSADRFTTALNYSYLRYFTMPQTALDSITVFQPESDLVEPPSLAVKM